MGIFSSIKNAIFGGEAKAAAPAAAPKAAPAAAPVAPAAPKKREAISTVDVAQRLDNVPGADKLNWRTSVVDLLKLVQIDPSYANRKELAGELGMTGYEGSAEDNIQLHKKLMNAIAAEGGIVPAELKD